MRALKIGSFFVASMMLQSCWLMGVCLDEEECEKYGNARESSSSSSNCSSSEIRGTWKSGVTTFFSFQSDCDFTGFCGLEGTYSSNSSTDKVTFTVTDALTSSECPDVGTYQCDYEIAADGDLELDCATTFGDYNLAPDT